MDEYQHLRDSADADARPVPTPRTDPETDIEREGREAYEWITRRVSKYARCERIVGAQSWCTMRDGHDGACYDDNAEPTDTHIE